MTNHTTKTVMRPFKGDDLEALIRIVEAHLREDVERHIGPWARSEAMLRTQMPAAQGDIKVVEDRRGQLVAFFWVTSEDPVLVLDEIHVVESARGQGLGKALMAEAATEAHRRGLTQLQLSVFAHSPQVAFYTKLGFKVLSHDLNRHQIKMGKRLHGGSG